MLTPMWCFERGARHVRAMMMSWATLLATLSAGSGLAAAEATTPSLKVSGSASFDTETRVTDDTFEVRVVLADEVGRPIAGAEARVRAHSDQGVATLRRCGDSRNDSSGELVLVTDAAGRSCVLVTGMARGELEFSYDDARGYYERATRRVRLPDSAADAFEIGFDPPLSTLPLDRPLQSLGLVARARAGATLPDTAELVLSLVEASAERELTRVALDGFGEVHRLSLVSAMFGQPGPARLIARLRTRAGQEHASASAAVLRTATATLQVPGAEAGIEPGVAVRVSVASALGPAPSGAVEVQSAGRSIAAARVQRGTAVVTVPIAATPSLGRTVTFEYVGEGPGWLSGAPVEARVRPAGPSYARSALWVIAAVLAALAVVLGWRRPPRPRPAPATPTSRVRASVELIEAFGPSGGYRGLVRDAHEGVAITPAVVSFVAAGPNGRVLLQLRTSDDGSFVTDEPSFPDGTLIEVTAPFHTTLTAPLPAPGVLELSLVSRRRALLERLVRWAERHGKPWIRQAGEPTPASLAATAAVESEPQVESWARAVEHLAFGASPPDAAREQAAGVTGDPKTTRERGID
jgi:hypothetical protein